MPLLNLRDVAAAIAPSPLAPERLFRSGQPVELTAQDVAPLIDAGVKTVIDLREPHEAREGDWALLEAAGARVLRVPLADQVLETVAGPAVDAGGDVLGEFYQSTLAAGGPSFAIIGRAIAAGSPTLVHCAAGKDRTGITVAVFASLIGIPRASIVADYELTKAAMPDVIGQMMGSHAPAGLSLEQILEIVPPQVLDAPGSAIESALAWLDRAGGARVYLSAAGLTGQEIDAIEAALTH